MNQSPNTKKITKICPKEKLAPAPKLERYLDESFILDHSENYEDFLLELGVKKHVRIKGMQSKPTVVLSRVKNHYVLSTSYPEGRYIKIKFRPGKEMSRLGRCQTSSVFHILDNKLIEEQNTDNKKILIEREFKRRDLIVTMEVNNVKCCKWYRLIGKSNHSINTETSRRSSLWENSLELLLMKSLEKRLNVTPEKTLFGGEEGEEEEEEEEDENVCY